MARLFVAISLPELASDALSQLQSGVDGARWVSSERYHLTLSFIGDVDRHGLEEAASMLDGVTAPAFDMTLSGCGYFGDNNPRALWVGVAPCDDLHHLQMKIETVLRRADFTMETRKFRPHATLAYVKHIGQDIIERYCAGHSLFRFGPIPVLEFHLYQSHLGGEAAHYEILETYQLSKSLSPSSSK